LVGVSKTSVITPTPFERMSIPLAIRQLLPLLSTIIDFGLKILKPYNDCDEGKTKAGSLKTLYVNF
jgi:hypothetical protein